MGLRGRILRGRILRGRTWAAVLAVGLALAGGARAQDLDGAYLGLYGAALGGVRGDSGAFAGGAFGGYRFEITQGTYLGAEADLLVSPGSGDARASGLGTLGVEVLPDALVYGHAGLAVDFDDREFWVAGAGVDFGLSDGVSLRLGGDRYEEFGGPATDWVGKAGVALSF